MLSESGFTTFETLPPGGRVHILGAGPVGLLLAALLQSVKDVDVRLYEKRNEYTRTRMVHLESYLAADSVENYCTDPLDGDNVEAVFAPAELDEAIAFQRSIPSDLMTLLRGWTAGLLPVERHRAVAQRSDRRACDGLRAARPRRRDAPRCDCDARTGRHPGRLHGQQVGVARSSCSRLPTTRTPTRIRTRSGSSTRS